ncbi:hypothetical protein JOD82_005968 [Paenibacillus sp. 1182]|nr:hypothetical protein [Paenibacillus sp. 1182]
MRKKVVSKAVQAAISKVVGAAKVGAKENKEEANNKKAGLKTSLQIVEKPRHFETWVSFSHHNALVSGEAGGVTPVSPGDLGGSPSSSCSARLPS